MRLDHQFTVPAPIEQVWAAVVDPERVAPCMPGATLTGVEGQTFTGTVKVKLGPISLLYKGSGEFTETDPADHRTAIKASGKDSRGNGTASATVVLTLTPAGPDTTTGRVVTDLSITGKPAQFGRGLISEVSARILDQFAACLADKLAPKPANDTPDPAGEGVQEDVQEEDPKTTRPSQEPTPRPLRVVQEDTAEPIDLLEVAGPSLKKRFVPVAIALALAVLAVILRRRR